MIVRAPTRSAVRADRALPKEGETMPSQMPSPTMVLPLLETLAADRTGERGLSTVIHRDLMKLRRIWAYIAPDSRQNQLREKLRFLHSSHVRRSLSCDASKGRRAL